MVQPEHRPPFRRVLAAVDPDPADPIKVEMNRRIVRTALAVAREEGAECVVLHAWAPHEEETLRERLDPESFDDYETELRTIAERSLRETLLPFADEFDEDRILLRRGDPKVVLPVQLETNRVDLAVMGTVARTGLQGLLIGNTAEVVMGKVSCSVLSVKPEGFRSPVCE